ncbi:MAG: flagellar protein FliS [Acetivibrio sp.]
MKQEKLNTYSVRITQANKSQLVVITYEIIIDSIQAAMEEFQREDWIEYNKDLKRVQKLLNELMGALDFSYEMSGQFKELYQFCGKCIVEALFGKKIDKLPSVCSIIEKMAAGFREAAKQDNSETVMKNTQIVYAGLTYGRYALDEVFVNMNEANRGFMA